MFQSTIEYIWRDFRRCRHWRYLIAQIFTWSHSIPMISRARMCLISISRANNDDGIFTLPKMNYKWKEKKFIIMMSDEYGKANKIRNGIVSFDCGMRVSFILLFSLECFISFRLFSFFVFSQKFTQCQMIWLNEIAHNFLLCFHSFSMFSLILSNDFLLWMSEWGWTIKEKHELMCLFAYIEPCGKCVSVIRHTHIYTYTIYDIHICSFSPQLPIAKYSVCCAKLRISNETFDWLQCKYFVHLVLTELFWAKSFFLRGFSSFIVPPPIFALLI